MLIKLNFKNYLKLGILFLGISFCLNSCQNQVLDEGFENQDMIFKKINETDIQFNAPVNKFISNFNKAKKEKSITAKSNSDLDFEIITSHGRYIETEYQISYTFPIKRNTSLNNNKLENLFLISFDGGINFDATIIGYDFKYNQLKTLSKEELQSRIITYTSIDLGDIQISGKESKGSSTAKSSGCVEVWEYIEVDPGDEGELVGAGNEEDPQFEWVMTSYSCSAGGGYSSGDGSGSGSSGGNSGGSGSDGDGTGDLGGGSAGGGSDGGQHTSPVDVCPDEDPNCENDDIVVDIMSCISDLTRDQINFLYNNYETAIEIDGFLDSNRCTQEASDFAGSILEDFTNIDSNDDDLITDFLSIYTEIPNAKFARYRELSILIEVNPWVLIQDCAQQNGLDTSKYLNLYNLPFPQECTNRLNNSIGVGPHQPITEGNVPLANIDYYGVEITTYPDFNNDGNPDSEPEMYQAFRNNFINLASGEVNNFQFSCNLPFNSNNTGDISWDFVPVTTNDGVDFISNNPIASILLIEADASGLGTLAADDGAVIVTHFNPNDWTIATIYTDNNGSQPFSGNRQWGWYINQNGNFEFFTRAVDVANISTLINIFSPADTECQQDTYYNVAEATWENMQQEIAQWVNDNGGQAAVVPKTAVRVNREKIEELLTKNEAISQINCD